MGLLRDRMIRELQLRRYAAPTQKAYLEAVKGLAKHFRIPPEVLARAGLHLGVSTIGRMRRQRLRPAPTGPGAARRLGRRLTASYPNHLWHADLTTVPTSAGFWSSWLPFALPQCWPFCWWLAVVLDHYSRRVLGFRLFLRTKAELLESIVFPSFTIAPEYRPLQVNTRDGRMVTGLAACSRTAHPISGRKRSVSASCRTPMKPPKNSISKERPR